MQTSTREVLDAICRTDLVSFARRSFNQLNQSENFIPNWHIRALAHHLEQLRRGEFTRLIINLPPRSLKSLVTSVAFPAFVLGNDPSARIIVVSYNSELAKILSNAFRTVVESDWYQEVFPLSRISPFKNTEKEVAFTKGGFRLATSFDGTLTGIGGNVIIIDDPNKSMDAKARRDHVNQSFSETVLSQLDDKQHGAIVVVSQRVHMYDLSGYLLSAPEQWRHLCVPAIAERDEEIAIGDGRFYLRRAGESFHEEREPRKLLDDMRALMGANAFSAQYQQAPMPPGGAMIKRKWVIPYDELPPSNGLRRIVQSWDTASKDGSHNDWSVGTTWLVQGGKYYLLHVLRDHYDYPMLKARAITHAQFHKASRILIEDAGIGTALITDSNGPDFLRSA